MTGEQDNSSNPAGSLGIEEKIDFSIKMRNAALDSAERRQAYEWKFCALVWTAIGGLIGVLLVNNFILDREKLPEWKLIILGSLILFVVAFFQTFCWLSNQVDKRRAEMYEKVIDKALHIDETKELKKARFWIRWTNGFWAAASQILLTAVLLWAFCCFYKAMPTNKEESNNPKPSVKNVAGIIINNGK